MKVVDLLSSDDEIERADPPSHKALLSHQFNDSLEEPSSLVYGTNTLVTTVDNAALGTTVRASAEPPPPAPHAPEAHLWQSADRDQKVA